MEFEIQGTGIRYQTGDHLAVWPVNPDSEVARLMKLLGLWEKRATAVEMSVVTSFHSFFLSQGSAC
jgi:NADPH-ferrihemoprotein reductase